MNRQPASIKTQAEWESAIEMLCYHCQRFPFCSTLEQMIEARGTDVKVKDGFVTDSGAGISCLSYKPKGRKSLSKDELINAIDEASTFDMCSGCAARKGTAASNSLHTNRDFKQCVVEKSLFSCHESPNCNRPCSGWANAIKHEIESN